MAIIVTETAKSRRFRVGADGSKFVLDYIVIGSNDEDAVWAAVYAVVPTAYKALPRSAFDFDPQGGGVWFVHSDFDPRKLNTTQADANAPDAGKDPGPKGPSGGGEGGGNVTPDQDPGRPMGRQMSFSTAGGTQHILYSTEMIEGKRAGDGAAAPDCIAIGWTRTGIAGVDVVAPACELTCNLQLLELTLGYLVRLFWLTGSVNLNPWNGFAAGEVLFLGADGHWVDGDSNSTGHTAAPGHWEISFRFKMQANRKNVDLGNGIVFDFVEGWDLIDCIYEESEEEVTGPTDTVMVQTISLAYIQRVYERKDFFDLGIDESLFAPE